MLAFVGLGWTGAGGGPVIVGGTVGSETDRGALGRVHDSGMVFALDCAPSFLLSKKKVFSFPSSLSGSTNKKLRSSALDLLLSCFACSSLRKLDSRSLPGDLFVGTAKEESEPVSKLASTLKCEVELDRQSFHSMVMLREDDSGFEVDLLSRKGRFRT